MFAINLHTDYDDSSYVIVLLGLRVGIYYAVIAPLMLVHLSVIVYIGLYVYICEDEYKSCGQPTVTDIQLWMHHKQ